MKFNKHVSSSRRKSRRRYYNAPSHIRRKIMSVGLSKAICREQGVPRLTLPIRKDDIVKVITGKYKDESPGKVVRVHRKKYRLYIENIQREKANGAQVKVPIHYSNVIITKLKMDGYRKRLLSKAVENKQKARAYLNMDPKGLKKAKDKKKPESKKPKDTQDLD
mmetsp:Transcript_724/g.974  ORF Transcript_724/g.974 Transcript_724/m.974 type:complete len:164 (+) Transcript_724:56-547(+)